MATRFIKLNTDWNADPNVPEPRVRTDGTKVVLEVFANRWQFPRFREGDVIRIVFEAAQRYRLGPTNDEGWYAGQCRFSGLAPGWGELYEIIGDPRLDRSPGDWHEVGGPAEAPRHFLFYLREQTFECQARAWRVEFLPPRS